MIGRKRILLIILVTASQFALGQPIAIATKVMGTVEINKNANPGYISLKPGTILKDGDGIRTGSDGFVLLIFIDDKSQLKVKEDSDFAEGEKCMMCGGMPKPPKELNVKEWRLFCKDQDPMEI